MPVAMRKVEIRMPEGTADAYVLTPDVAADGDLPGVIDLPDIRSIRDATLANSRRLAESGYLVLSPNVFYRTARPPVITFPMNFAEERTRRRVAELTDPLTPAAMHADAHAYINALAGFGANPGRVGVVGHCFTGAQALRTAAALPDQVATVASLHGGHLFTSPEDPSSPHQELGKIKASLFFAHAHQDAAMPAEKISALEAALQGWGGNWKSEVFSARHGWTASDSSSFDTAEAERAMSEVLELLRRCLR